MFHLPKDLIINIFSFDATYHTHFKKYVLRQLKNRVFFCKPDSIYCVIDLKSLSL